MGIEKWFADVNSFFFFALLHNFLLNAHRWVEERVVEAASNQHEFVARSLGQHLLRIDPSRSKEAAFYAWDSHWGMASEVSKVIWPAVFIFQANPWCAPSLAAQHYCGGTRKAKWRKITMLRLPLLAKSRRLTNWHTHTITSQMTTAPNVGHLA